MPKVLVLYITLDGLPNNFLSSGDKNVGGAMRIYDSFTSPWSAFWPPSMSLRSDVAAIVYSFNGAFKTRDLQPNQKLHDMGLAIMVGGTPRGRSKVHGWQQKCTIDNAVRLGTLLRRLTSALRFLTAFFTQRISLGCFQILPHYRL